MRKAHQQNKKPENEKRFVDEQTEKRNYEHLTNENDNISEEDISNVRTDVSDPNENISALQVKPEEPEEQEAKDIEEDKSKNDGIQTSWNILDE